MAKTAVLLLNLGGPDSLSAVKPFLYNLFADPDIIRLPWSDVFQKPLARYISQTREHEAQENYRLIGGKSPILGYTQLQAQALKRLLAQANVPVDVGVAMRYWHPLTEQALAQLLTPETEQLILLPLYPQFSYTTTASSIKAVQQALPRVMAKKGLYASGLQVSTIDPYYQHPLYLKALAETMQTGLAQASFSVPESDVTVVFSAHSLPERHVKRTQDPYPEQIRATAQAVMQQYFPNNPWELAFQSKVGTMRWLGPATDDVLTYLQASGERNVLLVPISFVSDHVETLFELDQLYIPQAREQGLTHCHRAPGLNVSPAFITLLAELVKPFVSSCAVASYTAEAMTPCPNRCA